MSELREIRPFFTALFHRTIPIDAANILSYVDELKLHHESLQNSNIGGWHSPTWTDLEDQPNSIVEIFNTIDEDMIELYEKYNIQKQPELDNFWIMSNGKYSYNRLHTHPGALFSGVIYIQVPSNSGNISFKRSDNLVESIGPYHGLGDYSFAHWFIPPEVGKVVYFTANVPHEVEQNLTEDENDQRIALAFNYR